MKKNYLAPEVEWMDLSGGSSNGGDDIIGGEGDIGSNDIFNPFG